MQTQHDKHVGVGARDRGIDRSLDGQGEWHVVIRRQRHHDAIGRAICNPERRGSYRGGGFSTCGLQEHLRRGANGRELFVNEIAVISRPHHQYLTADGKRLRKGHSRLEARNGSQKWKKRLGSPRLRQGPKSLTGSATKHHGVDRRGYGAILRSTRFRRVFPYRLRQASQMAGSQSREQTA